MNLKDILAISGYNGLFRFVSQGRSGVIVEGLSDKKRMNASSTLRISALDDIAIFTDEKEVSLKEVLRIIYQKENGGKALDSKSGNDKIKAYFESILPTYDRDKVYVSDMKKVIVWYNILQSLNLVDLEEDKADEENIEKQEENKKDTE
jgi:hypothetical protein